MNALTLLLVKKRIISSDILILICVYFIPAVAHILPVPLYLLDPMRILLLTGYLLSRNEKNAFFLAVTIPLFSMITTGHPTLIKSFLIATELMINMWLFVMMHKQTKIAVPYILFASIIISKIFYYILKYILLHFLVIEGELVTTDLLIQLATVVIITLVFSIIFERSVQPKIKD